MPTILPDEIVPRYQEVVTTNVNFDNPVSFILRATNSYLLGETYV